MYWTGMSLEDMRGLPLAYRQELRQFHREVYGLFDRIISIPSVEFWRLCRFDMRTVTLLRRGWTEHHDFVCDNARFLMARPTDTILNRHLAEPEIYIRPIADDLVALPGDLPAEAVFGEHQAELQQLTVVWFELVMRFYEFYRAFDHYIGRQGVAARVGISEEAVEHILSLGPIGRARLTNNPALFLVPTPDAVDLIEGLPYPLRYKNIMERFRNQGLERYAQLLREGSSGRAA